MALIYAIITLLTAYFQHPITFHQGLGWDGTDYYAVAKCVVDGKRPAAGAPFVNRVATPILAAVVSPRDLVEGFKIVNFTASTLTIILLVIWLRLYIGDWRIRVLMVLLYAALFHAPIRLDAWYPVLTESLTHLSVLVSLLLARRLERAPPIIAGLVFAAFIPFAVATRETGVVFAGAFVLLDNALRFDRSIPWFLHMRHWPSLWLLLPTVSAAATFFAIRHWVITLDDAQRLTAGIGPPNFYHAQNIVVDMVFDKGVMPYLLGWFMAFGPALALLIWKARDCVAYLWNRQFQYAFVFAVVLLSWLGGTGTERYLIWAFPVFLAMLGRIIESNTWLIRHPALVIVLAVSQAFSERVFAVWPDFPTTRGRYWVLFSAWGQVSALDLASYEMKHTIGVLAFAQYALMTVGLLLWVRQAESREKLRSTNPASP